MTDIRHRDTIQHQTIYESSEQPGPDRSIIRAGDTWCAIHNYRYLKSS
jgi:hypothetical protein